MKKDYIKIKKVSERLTGKSLKIRGTTPRFKKLIEQCNDTIEQILSKSELNEDSNKY